MAITLLRPAGKREKRNALPRSSASGSELGTEAARREGMAEKRAAYRARQRPRSDRGGAVEHGAAAHGCGNGKGLRAVALGAADAGGAAVYALRGREHGRTGGL